MPLGRFPAEKADKPSPWPAKDRRWWGGETMVHGKEEKWATEKICLPSIQTRPKGGAFGPGASGRPFSSKRRIYAV